MVKTNNHIPAISSQREIRGRGIKNSFSFCQSIGFRGPDRKVHELSRSRNVLKDFRETGRTTVRRPITVSTLRINTFHVSLRGGSLSTFGCGHGDIVTSLRGGSKFEVRGRLALLYPIHLPFIHGFFRDVNRIRREYKLPSQRYTEIRNPIVRNRTIASIIKNQLRRSQRYNRHGHRFSRRAILVLNHERKIIHPYILPVENEKTILTDNLTIQYPHISSSLGIRHFGPKTPISTGHHHGSIIQGHLRR